MHAPLTSLLESYGYVVLFLLVALESLGIPLPGATTLVTAAAFAVTGHLSIYWVVATAAVAAILGDNGGYWIGREGGLRFVRRYGRMLHVRETEIDRAHAFFARHGAKTVFFGRFIALLRTWAAVLAGVSSMPYGVFMVYNALGGSVWAVLFGTLGYLFGQNLPQLEHCVGRASLVLVLVVALAATLVLAARWFRRNSDQLARRVLCLQHQIASFAPVQRFRSRHPRAWEFALRRFTRGEYLGLHLAIGLLISMAALWLFGGITEGVIHQDPLTQFDLTLLAWFHGHATPTDLRISVAISWLGSPVVLTALGLVVALVLLCRRHMLLLAGWVATLVGGSVLDMTLKHVIQRPRPIYASACLHGRSFSFPSGHAMGSLVVYGMLAYLLVVFWTERRRTQLAIVLIAALLTVAIGVSRLYLGVHYFSDVVAGYAAGLLWLSACITGLEMARRQRGAARSWDKSR
jgi:membrane protein DedA with SNARE-associated domain/membrane-associated phospholipid phosphatase